MYAELRVLLSTRNQGSLNKISYPHERTLGVNENCYQSSMRGDRFHIKDEVTLFAIKYSLMKTIIERISNMVMMMMRTD